MLTEEERLLRTRESKKKYKYSDRGKEASARYYHSVAKREANARYRERNRWKGRVHSFVQRAKRLGVLLAQPCQVCGEPNAFAHHDDYNKPLEVQWFCNYHHSEYHRGLKH